MCRHLGSLIKCFTPKGVSGQMHLVFYKHSTTPWLFKIDFVERAT